MGAAHIARVARVAATIELWRAFEHRTEAPARRALIAAHNAALPPPITSTSNCD